MPSTPRKIAANRANAQKSTGPKTPEGRARAAQNSVKHGLNSERVLIPGEIPADFGELRQALLDEFQPATPDQALLFEHMVAAAWRLRRIRRIETAMFDALLTHHEEDMEERYEGVALDKSQFQNALLFRDCSTDFLRLSQYESRIYHQYRRSRADLLAIQAAAAKAQAEAEAKAEAEVQARAKAGTPAPAGKAPAPQPVTPTQGPANPSGGHKSASNSNKTEKIRVIGFVPPNSSPDCERSLPPASGAERNR
jgi:hypothetical protein